MSTVNGLAWQEICAAMWSGQTFDHNSSRRNGAYEVLVNSRLQGKASAATRTSLSRVRDRDDLTANAVEARVRKNTIYVGAGDQTESIVFWPDLPSTNYKACVVDEKTSDEGAHPGYMGVMHAREPNEEAYVVFPC